jgi:hypothetical protein
VAQGERLREQSGGESTTLQSVTEKHLSFEAKKFAILQAGKRMNDPRLKPKPLTRLARLGASAIFVAMAGLEAGGLLAAFGSL